MTARCRASLEADVNDLRLKATLYLAENHRRVCLQRLVRIYKGLISSLRLEYRRWMGPSRRGRRVTSTSRTSRS